MLQEFPRVLGIPEGHILDPAWNKINIDMQQFFHAQRQHKLWIFKFFPCSPKCKLVYTPQKQPFPTICSTDFCFEASRWGPQKAKVRQSRAACTEAVVPVFATFWLIFVRLISLVLDSCVSVLLYFFEVFNFNYSKIGNRDEKNILLPLPPHYWQFRPT